MCTALGIAGPNFSLACADTRFVQNDVVHSFTGRLRRVPHGWVASSGTASVVLRGLRELEVSGVTGADGAINKAVRECAQFAPPGSPSRFVIAADTGELLDVMTDRPTERSPAPAAGMSYVVQTPPGLADDGRRAIETMFTALRPAKSIEAVVRAVAGFVCDCGAQGGRLSGEVELGVTFNGQARYCHAPAGELAGASDADVGSAFTAPPVLPPFPHLPSEQRIFSLVPTIEV